MNYGSNGRKRDRTTGAKKTDSPNKLREERRERGDAHETETDANSIPRWFLW